MSTLGPVASTSTLRAGLRVIGRGMSEQRRWISVAILGSTIYGILTGGTAWVIGRVVHDTVSPAIAARSVTVAQLTGAGLLLAGVVVVALSGLAPMVLPATAFRALAVTEALSLYGGLGVFGAFVLYDMSKILEHARLAQMGAIPADPLRESIGLYLDAINIFTRLVAILSNGQRRKQEAGTGWTTPLISSAARHDSMPLPLSPCSLASAVI